MSVEISSERDDTGRADPVEGREESMLWEDCRSASWLDGSSLEALPLVLHLVV